MRPEIRLIANQFEEALSQAAASKAVEEIKVHFLGRKGPVQALMSLLKEASPEEKPLLGKEINDLKRHLEETSSEKLTLLASLEEKKQLEEEKLDVTLPGRLPRLGSLHPVRVAFDRILSLFNEMGFSVQLGPEIDTDFYNFEVLNFPEDHPARDMQDTFYLDSHHLLRTHTSNVQARVMEGHRPPIRIVAPGKSYRNEAVTARSHVMFHQVEGLYVDRGVSFTDLMSTFDLFLKRLFEREVRTRYRPSYFPFVEPGLEIDVSCLQCLGKGCHLCKQTGWLEVAGAGMVHPEVLKNCAIDPEVYSGFAWGMGVERLLMIEKGIPDIRLLWENDQRFLSQFPSL